MAASRGRAAADAADDAYRALVDGLHHGVLILEGARVAFANPAVTAATGYTQAELLAFSPADVMARVHPDDRALAEQRLAERCGDGPQPDGRGEYRLRCKDGSYRWFETHANRIPFRGAMATVVSLVDMTDRKRAERELAASEMRLRLLVDARNQYTLEMDPEGVIVHASAGFAETLGIPPDRVLGMSMGEVMRGFLHPDDLADGESNVANLLAGGVLEDALHRIRRHDGEYRWWETLARTFEAADGRHVAILCRDVTDRLAAQQERDAIAERLHQTEKLEGLGLLAGGIAHDFNNLMVAVRTNAELATRELAVGGAARRFVDDIALAAEQARDLTRTLLTYAGRTSAAIASVDLARVAESMAQLFRGALTERTMLSVGADAPLAFVVGDESQLRQLVLNLLRNAEEALVGRDGTISLRTGVRALSESDLAECVYVEGGRPGRFAYVSVVDTGGGISPEVIGRIFDPFFTTKEGGRGLGLASVLGTVRAHHGALRIATRPGGGSRFEVFLPAVASLEESAHAGLGSIAAAVISGAILVVDDQGPVRRAAAQLLQTNGYETLEARGGREAIEIARRAPEALGAVLLDVTMPDFGGNRVFGELRRMRADLPIVFMSGHSEEDVAALTKDRTRVATIAKPFSTAELFAALARVTRDDLESES